MLPSQGGDKARTVRTWARQIGTILFLHTRVPLPALVQNRRLASRIFVALSHVNIFPHLSRNFTSYGIVPVRNLMRVRTTNICIFGDSIAYGAWDASGGWVDRLRGFLHARTLASNFTDYYFVYHLGIPGNTTHDVLARFVSEVDAREPHVIICAVGINDSRSRDADRTPHVAEDIFRVNAGALIAEAKERAPKVFFIGLTRVDETKTMPYEEGIYFENKNILRYNAILKEMTREASLGFIEVHDTLDAKKDLIDGLHPNARGHEKLFNLIRDYLTEKAVIMPE